MDNFATIRIKKKTARRFREYSKFVAKSHTESVDVILAFF
ncbi:MULTISPECIES: BfmA/BtgA family mobilization protein [Christiangramia]